MTVYSSRRNIKRDRYCKRVIIIWRLRYRNTRVLFIHFSFPPPPSCISPSSLFPISLVLSSKINIAQRLSQVCQFIREIFSYIYHTHILFSYTYWRKCNVFVEARFASVSGTNHPRDEEHDIPAGGEPAGNPIFVPGSTLLPAQPVGYRLKRVCSRVHETREKFNKSARAPFFHGWTKFVSIARARAREREDDIIISRWRRCTVTRTILTLHLSPLPIGSRTR